LPYKVLLSLTPPRNQKYVSATALKAKTPKGVCEEKIWNIVKTHGKTPATVKTLNSTSKLKAKTCQFANNAGAKSQSKTRNGKNGEF
jgi:hypothetical protein